MAQNGQLLSAVEQADEAEGEEAGERRAKQWKSWLTKNAENQIRAPSYSTTRTTTTRTTRTICRYRARVAKQRKFVRSQGKLEVVRASGGVSLEGEKEEFHPFAMSIASIMSMPFSSSNK